MKTMPFNSIYGSTIDCACGKTHVIDPEKIVYSDSALEDLSAAISESAGGRSIVVLMDARTSKVAGNRASDILSDCKWQIQKIVVPDRAAAETPICDDQTYDWIRSRMKEADVVLSIGSGVLTDLGKWLASDLDLPFLSFATAASMNGYTSANVAPTIKGVKKLIRARPPRRVLSSPAILQNAPYELTAAGFGDILAKSVSTADWRMNHILFGDYYCDRAASLIADIEPLYMDYPENVRERKPEAIAALFHGLLLTGVAMTMAETSAPSSGGEHLISHTLDMMSSIDGEKHDLHGRQVGIGTVLASEIYRRVLSVESPKLSHAASFVDEGFWENLANEVAAQYTQKIERLQKVSEILSKGNAWDILREELKIFLRTPEQIRNCLQRAGAAYRAEDIGCSRERLLSALLHAHEIRSRFTIIDLARLLGILPTAAGEIVEQWS